ncbi:hypothetical protein [Novosphingobium sp.]|uniref:hypothetical protein n=1 Tax=Novosphingobium sp. TaxID=1874826 RepID=UPI003B527B69
MRYCAQCKLPEDLMDTCGRSAFGPEFQCPVVTEVADDAVVRVACIPCGKAFVVSASETMKGTGNRLTTCQLGQCAAKFVFPDAPAAPPKKGKASVPPPLTPDPVSDPNPPADTAPEAPVA